MPLQQKQKEHHPTLPKNKTNKTKTKTKKPQVSNICSSLNSPAAPLRFFGQNLDTIPLKAMKENCPQKTTLQTNKNKRRRLSREQKLRRNAKAKTALMAFWLDEFVASRVHLHRRVPCGTTTKIGLRQVTTLRLGQVKIKGLRSQREDSDRSR